MGRAHEWFEGHHEELHRFLLILCWWNCYLMVGAWKMVLEKNL